MHLVICMYDENVVSFEMLCPYSMRLTNDVPAWSHNKKRAKRVLTNFPACHPEHGYRTSISTFHACKKWDCHSDEKMEIKRRRRRRINAISLTSAKWNTATTMAPSRGVAILGAGRMAIKTLDCGRCLGRGGCTSRGQSSGKQTNKNMAKKQLTLWISSIGYNVRSSLIATNLTDLTKNHHLSFIYFKKKTHLYG